jgi:hypothetical protein
VSLQVETFRVNPLSFLSPLQPKELRFIKYTGWRGFTLKGQG